MSFIEKTRLETFALDIMMGYLIYDSVLESFYNVNVDTIAHHILGLVAFSSVRFSESNAGVFYIMLIMIAEGSTPFLHTTWVMHQLSLSSSPLFLVFAGILLISFFFLRVCLGPYITIHMMTSDWGEGYTTLSYLSIGIMFGFCLLNFLWFYKLVAMALKTIKKDKGEDDRETKKSKSEKTKAA
jgi:hypothetical protein